MADSLVMARMANENRLSYELGNLSVSVLGALPWKESTTKVLKTLGPQYLDLASRKTRCLTDAWASINLYRTMEPFTSTQTRALAHATSALFHRMELTGAIIDTALHRTLGDEHRRLLLLLGDQLSKVAHQHGLQEFSPTNDGHLRVLLYDKLGLPVLDRTTKTNLPKVDKITLGQLESPVVDTLLEYNRVQKLYSTNIGGVGDKGPFGLERFLVHFGQARAFLPTHYDSLGARTGRRSSKQPNFQNWQVHMRQMVVSRYPNGKIGGFDYSRLEVILIAWVAKEWKLLDAFTTGGGYIQVGKDLWGRDVIDGSPEYKMLKALVLGTDYNMGDELFAHELWVKHKVQLSADWRTHCRKAARLKGRYLETYPGLGRYMDARERELLSTGQIVAPDGGIRHLPCPDGKHTKGYGHLLNMAINYPIQHFASVVAGCALLGIEHELLALDGVGIEEYYRALVQTRKNYLTAGQEHGIMVPTIEYSPMTVIFNEVHDELVADFHPSRVARDREVFIETMKAPPRLRKLVPDFDVPLNVHAVIGDTWGLK